MHPPSQNKAITTTAASKISKFGFGIDPSAKMQANEFKHCPVQIPGKPKKTGAGDVYLMAAHDILCIEGEKPRTA